jgi:hypothetical protein
MSGGDAGDIAFRPGKAAEAACLLKDNGSAAVSHELVSCGEAGGSSTDYHESPISCSYNTFNGTLPAEVKHPCRDNRRPSR